MRRAAKETTKKRLKDRKPGARKSAVLSPETGAKVAAWVEVGEVFRSRLADPAAKPLPDAVRAEPNTEGEPAEAETIRELLASLFARGSGAGIEAEIARHEIVGIVEGALEEIEGWACRSPGEDRGRWAGRILGDFLSSVGKREKWLAARSPSFKSRVDELRSFSDLVHKQCPSPVTLWTLAAYERVNHVESVLALSGALGLAKSDVRNRYGFSELESSFPEKIACAMELPEAERGEALFSEIVWPWLCEHRAGIESETWAQEFVKTHGGGDQWSPSFANLKRDFCKSWRTVYSRPEGRLRGIERAPL